MKLSPSSSKIPSRKLRAVSLFASAGIGDAGLGAAGIKVVVANESLPYRCGVYRHNHPGTDVIEGDIWDRSEQVVAAARNRLAENELFLLLATPPCQGMSTNGAGRLKWEIYQGNRHAEDPRNRLIIPAMEIVQKLKPRWILFENVPAMRNTIIRGPDDQPVNIIEYIARTLGNDYSGYSEVIACEDYGIPQTRKRLVTIFSRDEAARDVLREGNFFSSEMRRPPITLREAIAHLPKLDGLDGKNDRTDFHRHHWVHALSEEKYWWIQNTPEGETAFNNQCVNTACSFSGNPRHRDIASSERNDESSDALWCLNCGSLLPRPSVRRSDGSLRLLKGFHSAYRRMRYDEPARALTQNFIYEASDNKIHPQQNRVLSILEAMIIQTADRYHYDLSDGKKDLSRARSAEIIGESVPPLLIETIVTRMIELSAGKTVSQSKSPSDSLQLREERKSYPG